VSLWVNTSEKHIVSIQIGEVGIITLWHLPPHVVTACQPHYDNSNFQYTIMNLSGRETLLLSWKFFCL